MTGALELQPSISDGDLARAAADGDRQAFAEIYDRYADRLYDFCVGLIGDRDAAADCVQDAFCVAATDLGGLREPDKLRPWLYSIARHHAMRRLRHRYREEVSDELPDMVSHEASPETLAGQSELARLVAEAAGGLSDRDRELLDLSYRHGLDGPELAEALGVTLTAANTMMFRMRQTVERCLGALLVARGAQANPDACPELAAILKGWDGAFSVLMRKRMARHIDACHTCEQDQRRQVNPVALLGGAPVFIPAPEWLRRQTLDRVQLTCVSSSLPETSGASPGAGLAESSGSSTGSQQTQKRRLALVVGIPLVCLGLVIAWFARPDHSVPRLVDTGADSSGRPLPVAPAAVKIPPATGHPQLVPPAGAARPALPTQQAQTVPGANAPSQTPSANNPGPAPAVVPATAGPSVGPAPAQIGTATVPDSDPNVANPVPQVDTAPPDTAPVDTAPVDTAPVDTAPVGTAPANTAPANTAPIGTSPPANFGSVPNLNTSTITNSKGVTPNLQANIAPNSGTNTTGSTGTTTKGTTGTTGTNTTGTTGTTGTNTTNTKGTTGTTGTNTTGTTGTNTTGTTGTNTKGTTGTTGTSGTNTTNTTGTKGTSSTSK